MVDVDTLVNCLYDKNELLCLQKGKIESILLVSQSTDASVLKAIFAMWSARMKVAQETPPTKMHFFQCLLNFHD